VSLEIIPFQAGFVKCRTIVGIFLKLNILEKHLRAKRDIVYWCFVDFEEAFDSFDREAWWFKMRKSRAGENTGSSM
jgi:hypothetical protein